MLSGSNDAWFRRMAITVAENRRREASHAHVRADNEPFALAGLWEQWQDPAGDFVLSYTILTTAPTASVKHIHDRMPLVLNPEQEDYWLYGLRGTTTVEDRCIYKKKLASPPDLASYPVSNRVNSPRHDDPLCIKPAER